MVVRPSFLRKLSGKLGLTTSLVRAALGLVEEGGVTVDVLMASVVLVVGVCEEEEEEGGVTSTAESSITGLEGRVSLEGRGSGRVESSSWLMLLQAPPPL